MLIIRRKMMRKLQTITGVTASALILGVAIVVHATPADKVALCHQTGSKSNPYVVQEVAANEVQSHEANGDFVYKGELKANGHPLNSDWCSVKPEVPPTAPPVTTDSSNTTSNEVVNIQGK